jgi:hypothetical protein
MEERCEVFRLAMKTLHSNENTLDVFVKIPTVSGYVIPIA